jgi:hypothetical protein
MSGTLVEFPEWEAVPAEVAPEQGVTTADKITNIAQLPSIWKLEQPIEWLIDGIIPLGSINLLSGESGGGKTWLA